MTTSNNIIMFPKQTSVTSNPDLKCPSYQEIREAIDDLKAMQMIDVTNVLADSVIETLVACGYDYPIDTIAQNDFYLVYEAIRAMICKYHNEEHIFHDLAQTGFHTYEDGSFSFLAHSIKIKPHEPN